MPTIGDRVAFQRQRWNTLTKEWWVESGEGILIQHGRYRAVRLDDGEICVLSSTDYTKGIACPSPPPSPPSVV